MFTRDQTGTLPPTCPSDWKLKYLTLLITFASVHYHCTAPIFEIPLCSWIIQNCTHRCSLQTRQALNCPICWKFEFFEDWSAAAQQKWLKNIYCSTPSTCTAVCRTGSDKGRCSGSCFTPAHFVASPPVLSNIQKSIIDKKLSRSLKLQRSSSCPSFTVKCVRRSVRQISTFEPKWVSGY